MKRFAVVLGFALVLGVALSAAVVRHADVTGKWAGVLHLSSDDGMKQDLPTELDLKQDGADITGKIGDAAKPDEMLAITKGKMSDDDVTLESENAGAPHVVLNLKLADGHLTGDGTFALGDLKMKAKFDGEKK